MGDLIPMLNHRLKQEPVPQTVVIHLGTNDLFSTPVKDLRRLIEEGLRTIRHMLPNTRIVWSDVLPWLFYYGEVKKGVGKRNWAAINKFAHKICGQLGNAASVVHSHNISQSNHTLYRRDRLHLSASGNLLFSENIHNGLAFFALSPEALHYPTISQ